MMALAITQAKKSLCYDEVPIGAVIVCNGKILAQAHNLKETMHCPTQHAELIAIQKAAKKIKDWRLNECTLYTTLEPCPMCAGAILQARIKRVVYGAKDRRWGAAGTIIDLFKPKLFNHTTQIDYLPNKTGEKLLTDFFKCKREKPLSK